MAKRAEIRLEILGDASDLSKAVGSAKSDLDSLGGKVTEIDGKTIDVKVDADTKPAETTIEQLPSKVNKLDVPVGADISKAKIDVEALPNSVGTLHQPVDADIRPAQKTIGDIPNSTKILVAADADITMARKTIGEIPKNIPTLRQPVDADTGLAKKTIGDIPNTTKLLVPTDVDIAPAKKTLGAPGLLPPLKQPLDIDYSPIDRAPDEIKSRWSTRMSTAFDLITTYAEPAVEIVGAFATVVGNIKAAERARELEDLADGIDAVSYSTKFSQLDTSWTDKFQGLVDKFDSMGKLSDPNVKGRIHDMIYGMQVDVANLAAISPESAGKVQLWLEKMLAIGALDKKSYDLLHESVVRVVGATDAAAESAPKAEAALAGLKEEANRGKTPFDNLAGSVGSLRAKMLEESPPLKVDVDPEKKRALDAFVGGIDKWVDEKHETTVSATAKFDNAGLDSVAGLAKSRIDAYFSNHPVSVQANVTVSATQIQQSVQAATGQPVSVSGLSPASASVSTTPVVSEPPPGSVWNPAAGWVTPSGQIYSGQPGGTVHSVAPGSDEGPPATTDPTTLIAYWKSRGYSNAQIASIYGWSISFVESHQPSASRMTAATGAWVRATPGGVPVTVAEGGEDEVIAPEPMLRQIVRQESGNGGVINITVLGSLVGGSPRDVALALRDELIKAKREGVTIGLG